MWNLLRNVKESKLGNPPEEGLDRLLKSEFQSKAKTDRPVASEGWTKTAEASDGSWANFTTNILSNPPRRLLKRVLLGTMTVRVFYEGKFDGEGTA